MYTIRQTAIYQKWFANLTDSRAKARIDVRIRRLGLGNPGDTKPVGAGVTELRMHYGPGYRIYFTRVDSEIIVLLAGGNKSSQSRDILKAKELASEL